ncbi:MAG: hypothetical protein WBG90_02870 [Saonia sp.]
MEVLKSEGEHPLEFVQKKLDSYDLIIFDDALHNAVEPFDFYQELLGMEENKIEYVFIEAFGIHMQSHIDAYLENASKDPNLLLKVFQDSFNGSGWRYETYYELLSTVWDINHSTDLTVPIKVKAVDQPIYWEGIHNRKAYDVFLKSLIGRDYFMYLTILDAMDSFSEGKKGIFLTNTRHAYKHIKNSEGSLYWNCGTFFNQWHPGKTYAARIHNVTLSITENTVPSENTTASGLERYTYEWVKMQDGIWDEAFAKNGNAPLAFSLKNNVFGDAKYIGNHMLNVAKDQTMYDAYDALIFLAPLNELHFSAKIDFIFTDDFKMELKRRLKILHEDNMDAFLTKNKASSLSEYIVQLARYQEKTKNSLVPH